MIVIACDFVQLTAVARIRANSPLCGCVVRSSPILPSRLADDGLDSIPVRIFSGHQSQELRGTTEFHGCTKLRERSLL